MKKYLFGSYILIVSLLLVSCKINNSDPDPVTFVYPGFSLQISKDELNQNNARIWLGDVRASVRISI